ncbi:hypothetical protein GCM10007358_02710 [Phocicoccus schoeneichii]|uniref:Uncharacterized protein n=1 Tax=Phocicoccus schoeneichii TaxID=1812261 RepID=A0A6V7RHC5_9BACL|nr:hypothetical protein [Jeotgalicoccus schoeneichii]GGH47724.1 hypothetical protein GCM10007358_02710 [Jeotgalicoccus schoeneichii]CAD2077359.1 hypothetical protein JEOSCH030_01282 [Jeotgalicoccus schoeneichii]
MFNMDILSHFNDEYTKPLEPIITYVNNETHILKDYEIVKAVVTFNLALLLLDNEPDKTDMENHVLYGDLYLSMFYITLSKYEAYDILTDVLDISKEIINLKSLYLKDKQLKSIEKTYILFGPILYLRDRFFIDQDIDQVLELIMQNGDFNG